MSDVLYKGYTIKLRSRPVPSGMWEPRHGVVPCEQHEPLRAHFEYGIIVVRR